MAVYLGDCGICHVEFLFFLYDLYLYVYLCCISLLWYFQPEKEKCEGCIGMAGEVYRVLCGGVDDCGGYFSAGHYDVIWYGQISGGELCAVII